MIQPSFLKEVERDGYDLKTTYRDVLQELDVRGVEAEHSTMESAVAEILDKKELLKSLKLTILPVFNIHWDGEIS